MLNKKNKNFLRLIGSLLCLVCLLGCVCRECTVSREVSTRGEEGSQRQRTQEYRGPRGQKIIDKQSVKEKTQCVSKKTGIPISAKSEEECFKRGGKMVDEIITEESTSFRK